MIKPKESIKDLINKKIDENSINLNTDLYIPEK